MRKIMSSNLKQMIKKVRKDIENNLHEFGTAGHEYFLKSLDDYIENDKISDLEKAFFLMLNQWADEKRYIVAPNEKIRVPNFSRNGPPLFKEYEIDFAIYSGTCNNPVKIAIECDGKRSHGEKFKHRDRKKDINLQCNGWIIIRMGSREIHEELEKIAGDNFGYLIDDIEYLIETRADYIKGNYNERVRQILTGYEWGHFQCPLCKEQIYGRLNASFERCNKCNKTFHPPKYDHFDYVE